MEPLVVSQILRVCVLIRNHSRALIIVAAISCVLAMALCCPSSLADPAVPQFTLIRQVQDDSGGLFPFLSAVYSPDGTKIVTANYKRVYVWQAASKRLLKAISTSDDCAMTVTFSPQGELFATGGIDHGVRLWHTSTNSLIRNLAGHDDSVLCLSFSPDGKLLASGGENRSIRVWNVASGQLLAELNGHQERVLSADFTENSQLIVSGSSDGTVRIWDWRIGKQLDQLEHSEGPVVLSPDKRILACIARVDNDRDRRVVCLWDLKKRRESGHINIGSGHTFGALAFSPDGRILAGYGKEYDTGIRLWEVRSGSRIRQFYDGLLMRLGFSLAFSPDGRYLVACGFHRDARVYDLSSWLGGITEAEGGVSLESLWMDLASQNASVAHKAIWTFVSRRDKALAWFRNRLALGDRTPPARIQALIQQLDDQRFDVRERASRQLVSILDVVEPSLRRQLSQGSCSAEQRRRLELILEEMPRQQLVTDRAISVLEYMGTDDARKVLEQLASGERNSFLTEEAGRALERVSRRLSRCGAGTRTHR
jgi:WD40 repeat protein